MSAVEQLAAALDAAQAAGMVLDVSRIQANGLGAVPAPSNGTEIQGFPFISDNLAGYQTAMTILGPDYEGMTAAYQQQYGAGTRAATPVRPPSPRVATPVRPPSPRVATPVRPPSPVVVRPPSPRPVTVVRPPSPRAVTVVRPPSPVVVRPPSPVARPPSPVVAVRPPSPRPVTVVVQPPAVQTTAAATKKAAKPPQTPQEKVIKGYNKAQAAGNLLDVSKLQNDGTGYKSVKPPKTTRGTKRGIDPVGVVSDNYAAYNLAMTLLGPTFIPYSNLYLTTYGGQQILPQTQQKKATAGPSNRYGDIIYEVPAVATVNLATVTVRAQGTKTPRTPRAKSPKPKTPKTPKTPKAKTPKAKTPKAKTPRATKAKTPKVTTGGIIQLPPVAAPPILIPARPASPRATRAVAIPQ